MPVYETSSLNVPGPWTTPASVVNEHVTVLVSLAWVVVGVSVPENGPPEQFSVPLKPNDVVVGPVPQACAVPAKHIPIVANVNTKPDVLNDLKNLLKERPQRILTPSTFCTGLAAAGKVPGTS